MRAAKIDHRLDRENHALLELRSLIGAAVMKDIGCVVKKPADAMAAEVSHDRTTLGFGVVLDRLADRPGARAWANRGYAAHQTFMRNVQQALGGALYLTDRIHTAGIAVPAIDDIGHVDVDDVPFA